MSKIQNKRWCITLPNYVEEDEKAFLDLFPSKASYVIVGKEISPSTGTPHLQIYLELVKKKTLGGLKKLLPSNRCHAEVAKGSGTENQTYCQKERNYQEVGALQCPGKRTDLDEVAVMLQNGVSLKRIALEATTVYVKYYRGIERVRALINPPQREGTLKVEVFYGPTGTGKSRLARHLYGGDKEDFWIHGGDRWFDGYTGQSNCLFDDFQGVNSGISYRKCLQILDRYDDGQVPVKFGFVSWAPKVVVITTNIHPTQWYPEEKDISPLMRRIGDGIRDFHIFPYNP